MITIYFIIGGFSILLCLYLFWAYKLKRNKPNIKGELEIFPVPEKKSVTNTLDEMLADARKQLEIDPVAELEKALNEELDKNFSYTFPPAIKVDSIEVELEVTIDWFEKQKQKALRQLKRYKFNSLEFVPNWTFEDGGQVIQTKGYHLDAVNTLKEVISEQLINKRRVVFYLSKESDGIYHIQQVSGGKKNEATITVQVWYSDI